MVSRDRPAFFCLKLEPDLCRIKNVRVLMGSARGAVVRQHLGDREVGSATGTRVVVEKCQVQDRKSQENRNSLDTLAMIPAACVRTNVDLPR